MLLPKNSVPFKGLHYIRFISIGYTSKMAAGLLYVLKRVSLGSKDCTKEQKLEYAYFLGQTS